MKTALKALLLSSVMCAPVALADDGFAPSQMPEFEDVYKSIVQLPGTKLTVAEVHGQLVILTENKRFAVVGHLVDTLERKELKTLDDVKAARRMSISSLKLDDTQLSEIKYGNGPKQAVIFIDTECTKCSKMLQEVKSLKSQYTFRIVLMTIMSQASVTNAAKVLCATDKDAALEAIFTRGYDKLPNQTPQCAAPRFAATFGMSMALSIHAVPFVIAPNGETSLGLKDASLTTFLASNRS